MSEQAKPETTDAAVLDAVGQLSPHATWRAIADRAGVPVRAVRGALDRLEAAGHIRPAHWHNGKSVECVNDA